MLPMTADITWQANVMLQVWRGKLKTAGQREQFDWAASAILDHLEADWEDVGPEIAQEGVIKWLAGEFDHRLNEQLPSMGKDVRSGFLPSNATAEAVRKREAEIAETKTAEKAAKQVWKIIEKEAA